MSIFPHDNSKNEAARITILEMFHQEFWKYIYFGIKRSKVKVTRHKKCVGLQTDPILPLAANVLGVLPAEVPRPASRTSHASDTGFFLRHARQPDRRFFRAYSSLQSTSGKTLRRGSWHSCECWPLLVKLFYFIVACSHIIEVLWHLKELNSILTDHGKIYNL